MTQCKYCQEEIEWTKSGDKSIPMNPDGTRHQCKGGQKPAPAKSQEPVKSYHLGTLKAFMQPNIVVADDKKGDITLYAKEKWALIENIPVGSRVEYSFNHVGNLATITTTSAPMPAPGFKTGNEIKKEIDQGAKPDFDRMNGPADGECVSLPGGTIIKPPLTQVPVTTTASTSPSQPAILWSDVATIDIECTVNLDNYENIKVRVSGSNSDRDKLIALLNDTLGQFGKDEITRAKIAAYQRRVIVRKQIDGTEVTNGDS